MENTFNFKTTLKCAGCVAKVKPLLDSAPEIVTWSVNLGTPDKILTVKMKNTDTAPIVKLFETAGYKAELFK